MLSLPTYNILWSVNFKLSAPLQHNSFHNILLMHKFTKLRNYMKFHFITLVTMLPYEKIGSIPHILNVKKIFQIITAFCWTQNSHQKWIGHCVKIITVKFWAPSNRLNATAGSSGSLWFSKVWCGESPLPLWQDRNAYNHWNYIIHLL